MILSITKTNLLSYKKQRFQILRCDFHELRDLYLPWMMCLPSSYPEVFATKHNSNRYWNVAQMESHISEFTSISLGEEIFTDVLRIPSDCKGLVEQEGTKADVRDRDRKQRLR